MTIQPLSERARQEGGLSPDDLVASLGPLFRQVVAAHAEGLVAPLEGIEALSLDRRSRIRFDPGLAHPALLAPAEVAAAEEEAAELRAVGLDPAGPALEVRGWQTWEHRAGHHDELTDVASLGLLLAALACGLDLHREDDAAQLAAAGGNLFLLKPDLHPVIAQLAGQLLHPDRHARLPDLPSALQRLETHRDQPLKLSLHTV